MACTLSNTGIQKGCTILASQISQSVDAFTKAEAYDVTLSGSLIVTGSSAFSSSDGSFSIEGIIDATQDNILSYNINTGGVTYQAATSLVESSIGVYYTSSDSGYAFEIQPHDTDNKVTGSYSAILGGNNNEVSNQSCTVIVGGFSNTITSSRSGVNNFIGGGNNNEMSNTYLCYNSILGGRDNEICGLIDAPNTAGSNTQQNIIGGGYKNIISGSVVNSIIGSGTNNLISGCVNSPALAFIGSGDRNVIRGCSHYGNSIVGGCKNRIDPFCISPSCTEVRHSAILGGINNTASACESYIIGGCENYAKHTCSFIVGSNIESVAVCTTHVNNMHVGCTVQLQPRTPIGTGQSGMLIACDLGGGRSKLYYHDGQKYREVCLAP